MSRVGQKEREREENGRKKEGKKGEKGKVKKRFDNERRGSFFMDLFNKKGKEEEGDSKCMHFHSHFTLLHRTFLENVIVELMGVKGKLSFEERERERERRKERKK